MLGQKPLKMTILSGFCVYKGLKGDYTKYISWF